MTYSISKGQQGEKVLMIDGLQSICPFVSAIPFQGNMGQVQIMRMPCSTLCPHAKYTEKSYKINCGTEIRNFELAEDDKDTTTSKLVSL
jgi:hypothetical protein